jgi:hypothetical protein
LGEDLQQRNRNWKMLIFIGFCGIHLPLVNNSDFLLPRVLLGFIGKNKNSPFAIYSTESSW